MLPNSKDRQRNAVTAVIICVMFLLVALSIMNFVNSPGTGTPTVTSSETDTPPATPSSASTPTITPIVAVAPTATSSSASTRTIITPVASQSDGFSSPEFQEVLDSIQTKTGSTHEIIERLLIFNQEELKKGGQTESLLELAHHIDDSMAAGYTYSATQMFAMYTVMRTTPLK